MQGGSGWQNYSTRVAALILNCRLFLSCRPATGRIMMLAVIKEDRQAAMAEPSFKLKHPPIVEMVLDIDCDMPPAQPMKSLESLAKESFQTQYPKLAPIFMHEHRIETKPETPTQFSTQQTLCGFRFLHDDEKQLVQVRAQGFSFNRLAPYSTLDDYVTEIERTWKLFVQFASPVQVRLIRLRYINRIPLPASEPNVALDQYLNICPHLPDEQKLQFISFLNHHAAVERTTGRQVNIILASQAPENGKLPVIFDIAAANITRFEPNNWAAIFDEIQSLRSLQRGVFRNSLTEKCLDLFQQ
jgi:uncharacterized protein (TIGR04255 family)